MVILLKTIMNVIVDMNGDCPTERIMRIFQKVIMRTETRLLKLEICGIKEVLHKVIKNYHQIRQNL